MLVGYLLKAALAMIFIQKNIAFESWYKDFDLSLNMSF